MNAMIPLLYLALLAGACLLQIFLSKREPAFPGLILPIISFLAALLFVLNMAMPPEGMTGRFIGEMLVAFLLSNIPTAIFLSIYFACRKRNTRKKQLDKMNIQDLD